MRVRAMWLNDGFCIGSTMIHPSIPEMVVMVVVPGDKSTSVGCVMSRHIESLVRRILLGMVSSRCSRLVLCVACWVTSIWSVGDVCDTSVMAISSRSTRSGLVRRMRAFIGVYS